jgi:hypothetical protein
VRQCPRQKAFVGLGATTGSLDVFVAQQSGEVQVIIDVSGYFD